MLSPALLKSCNSFLFHLCQIFYCISLNLQVRMMNLYKQGDYTPFKQCLDQFTIHRCWEECMTISDFHQWKAKVEQYNKWVATRHL